MKKLIILGVLVITLLSIVTVAGCQKSSHDLVQNIIIYNAQSPDYPPPPGGWTFQTSGSYPAQIQRLFDHGDKILLGLVISEDIEGEVTFSRVAFFNRSTNAEETITISGDDLGPFEPGWRGLLGLLEPWPVPDEDGEYELRLYTGEALAASALFNVGIWPASWGPEMIRHPAPIYDVKVIFGQEQPKVDVAVYIKGGLPQGCEASHWYSVEPTIGDTVYIEVGVRHLKDTPCEDEIFFEETVNLWPSLLKGFVPGETYSVDVNGHVTPFVMPQPRN